MCARSPRELVAEIAERGRADLYETLAKPLPMLMITNLLGIERDEAFWEWTDTLMYGRVHGISQDAILAAAVSLYGFLDEMIETARAQARRRPHLAAAGRQGRRAAVPRGRDPRPLLLPAHRRAREHRLRHPRDAPPPGRAARPPRRGARRAGAREQPRRAVAAPLRARDRPCAHSHVRQRGGRAGRSGRGARAAAVRLGQPRWHGLREGRRVPPRPARRTARRIRHRPAPLRRLAPRAPRDARRGQELLRASRTSSSPPGPDPGWYAAGPLEVVWDVAR